MFALLSGKNKQCSAASNFDFTMQPLLAYFYLDKKLIL
jgi:hypothetical protein